jgi:choline dehydrogenase-like flavoprotein
MDCVVGSGPAGVACATALLQRGRPVLMLDAGICLEADRAKVVRSLANAPPEQWPVAERQWLRDGMKPSAQGIPFKLLFGSDYPYRDAERELGADYRGIGLRASLAFGGLSTVWGAAMLPYLDRDIADWPVTTAELAPHYRAALELTGLSAAKDDLAKLLPLFTDSPGQLASSQQTQIFLRTLDRQRDKLRRAGIYYGRARVAIRAARDAHSPGCVYCGMCVYGCPYGYIYNSADTVAQLQCSKKFTY